MPAPPRSGTLPCRGCRTSSARRGTPARRRCSTAWERGSTWAPWPTATASASAWRPRSASPRRSGGAALEDPILDHARRTSGGDVIWLHPASFRGESPRPVGIGWGLYDGVAGVALFLAALDRVEGSDARREMVLDTLAPLRRHLRQ